MDSTILLLWIQLACSAAIILFEATQLTKNADFIAFKTGLGRAFVGVVLLATAPSLPELGTGVSAVSLVGGPDGANLAAGDAFGSNLFNLLIIGIIDILWRNGSIISGLGVSVGIVGILGVLVIGVAASSILIHVHTDFMSDLIVSPMSFVVLVVFILALYAIYREEKSSDSEDVDVDYSDESLTRAFFIYGIAALIVVGAAIWLAQTGNGIANEMGWGKSFVGTQFLALSTSLPELAASIAALRIMAPELAITNVLGSNLFNMGFVLFLDDVAYTDGPIWNSVSTIHVFTAILAMVMTMVVLVPLIGKSKLSFGRIVSLEAGLLIGLYVVGSILVFVSGGHG